MLGWTMAQFPLLPARRVTELNAFQRPPLTGAWQNPPNASGSLLMVRAKLWGFHKHSSLSTITIITVLALFGMFPGLSPTMNIFCQHSLILNAAARTVFLYFLSFSSVVASAILIFLES